MFFANAPIELVLAETGRPAITRELVAPGKSTREREEQSALDARPWRRLRRPRVTINLIAALHFFDAKLSEFELTFPDPMYEFDAGNRRCGSPKLLEAKHRTRPELDRSVILLDQIVYVF